LSKASGAARFRRSRLPSPGWRGTPVAPPAGAGARGCPGGRSGRGRRRACGGIAAQWHGGRDRQRKSGLVGGRSAGPWPVDGAPWAPPGRRAGVRGIDGRGSV